VQNTINPYTYKLWIQWASSWCRTKPTTLSCCKAFLVALGLMSNMKRKDWHPHLPHILWQVSQCLTSVSMCLLR